MLSRVQAKANDLESYLPERLVDEGFRWQTLARLLAGKLARKVTGGRVAPHRDDPEPRSRFLPRARAAS